MISLDDFENSSAAYEKAIELGKKLGNEDPSIFLNYAITLYLNDEVEKSREQFSRFEVLHHLQSDAGGENDPEVLRQADMLRKVLN